MVQSVRPNDARRSRRNDMPHEIRLDHLPAGYVLEGAPKGGEVTVCFRDFFSSEDGQDLIHHLEGTPRDVIARLPKEAKANESTTESLLVVIRKDQTQPFISTNSGL